MNVYLYHVEGISRIDTPYFATKTIQASLSKQEEFFDNHLVKTVELSFYPPHYRNSIRFEEEDLTIMDNVNYLSLEYNGKRYYYFIDSVEYISETLIEVEITMDVIQTYMFDIYISNGIIERKFINRYSSGSINRSYIRENVSNNEYVYYTHQVYNSNIEQWLVFIPVTSYLCNKTCNMLVKYDTKLPGLDTNGFINTSYCCYITSYYPSVISGNGWHDNPGATDIERLVNTLTDASCDITTAFGEWSSHNVTVDMYICPFNCSSDITLTYVSSIGKVRVTVSETYDTYDPYVRHTGGFYIYQHSFTVGSQEIYTYCLAPDNDNVRHGSYNGSLNPIIKCKVFKGNQDIGLFGANSVIGTAYHSKYITQMLDENYIQIKYGSINNYTSIPLYYLKNPRLKYYAAFNPTDGSRIYWLTDYDSSTGEDKYNTVVIDNNTIHYDLKNDPWKNYIAANRGRWAAATVNTALSIFSKGAYNGQNAAIARQGMDSILNNPKNIDRRYKESKLKTKPAAMLETKRNEMARADLSAGIGAVEASSNLISQAFQDYNVMCTPPSPKQVGNVSGIGAKDAYIMYYEEHVQDYEQCAQYYHRNGFLVNEYINAKADIFGYVFNRYYFNILKMQLPNVHLHNVIEDEDTCNAIADRLVDGVRLWNVNNPDVVIGDFQYDNVENDFLS